MISGWTMLIASLSGPTKAARMRLWRALRAAGAAALRDGVYLLPDSPAARRQFEALATEVRAAGGSAELAVVPALDEAQEQRWRALFDRGSEHAALLERVRATRALAQGGNDAELKRSLSGLRRESAALAAIDFFPGPARAQLDDALEDAESALRARSGAFEPHARPGPVTRRDPARYRRRLWATRRHLWVDRVASAWLIRRFIDPEARFRWLREPKECPKTAVGFDFDGAEFTHVGARVTFEVLLVAFGLDRDTALARLGSLVHALDVGGAPAAEAAGLLAILNGYRSRGLDDDAMLDAAGGVLDALYAAFSETPS